ncbi:hypothetical protein EYF80_010522 [Liparis tanakae]|uniref:Uncharacterized protein n=1 Tax=Liparis tanakae TaxID=230148 RepID=A0A4Z2INC8_9TELE|nr:hypothetical protein EYF80_010522 [Liparis tanakae]
MDSHNNNNKRISRLNHPPPLPIIPDMLRLLLADTAERISNVKRDNSDADEEIYLSSAEAKSYKGNIKTRRECQSGRTAALISKHMEITFSGGGGGGTRVSGMADVVEADNRTIGCSGKRGGAAVPEALPRPGAGGASDWEGV